MRSPLGSPQSRNACSRAGCFNLSIQWLRPSTGEKDVRGRQARDAYSDADRRPHRAAARSGPWGAQYRTIRQHGADTSWTRVAITDEHLFRWGEPPSHVYKVKAIDGLLNPGRRIGNADTPQKLP